jgi:hypothetical protein
MKILVSENTATGRWWSRGIWILEASIVFKHSDPTTALLLVEGSLCVPASDGCPDVRSFHDRARFAGVTEATDQEMRILLDAGYFLRDLRAVPGSELLEAL